VPMNGVFLRAWFAGVGGGHAALARPWRTLSSTPQSTRIQGSKRRANRPLFRARRAQAAVMECSTRTNSVREKRRS
jgi:hypothetical protein